MDSPDQDNRNPEMTIERLKLKIKTQWYLKLFKSGE